MLLVASPFADRSQLDFVTPHQRKHFSLICNEPDGYYQVDMDKYLAKKDIIMNPHMKVQSIEAVKRCVMNNLGIAVVPTYSIGEELKNGSLIPVKTELDEKVYNGDYEVPIRLYFPSEEAMQKKEWRSSRNIRCFSFSMGAAG